MKGYFGEASSYCTPQPGTTQFLGKDQRPMNGFKIIVTPADDWAGINLLGNGVTIHCLMVILVYNRLEVLVERLPLNLADWSIESKPYFR